MKKLDQPGIKKGVRYTARQECHLEYVTEDKIHTPPKKWRTEPTSPPTPPAGEPQTPSADPPPAS